SKQAFVNNSKILAHAMEGDRTREKMAEFNTGSGDKKEYRAAGVVADSQPGASQNMDGSKAYQSTLSQSREAGTAFGAAQGLHPASPVFEALALAPGAQSSFRRALDIIGGGVTTWGNYESALRQADRNREADILSSHLFALAEASPYETFARPE